MEITHRISGELWQELRHGTSLGAGRWGYGASDEIDAEVERMVVSDSRHVKRGFGTQVEMTGSPEAWRAIADYAADRGYMEQNLSGDFDASTGQRMIKQADRIFDLIGKS